MPLRGNKWLWAKKDVMLTKGNAQFKELLLTGWIE